MVRKIVFLFLLFFFFIGCFSKVNIDLSTPEKALGYYIESLRNGDIHGVLESYDTRTFYLPRPVKVSHYNIVAKKILRSDDLKKLEFIPKPIEDDAMLEVIEYLDGKEERVTYYLRLMNGKWKIYTHYSWSDNS